MSAVRNNLLTLATVSLIAMGGCATTGGGSLSSSAERLERTASSLHEEARDDGARQGFRSDARELAEEAREFRETLSDRSADDEDVSEAFSDVSRRYHAMRDEVERSRSREAEKEFQPVTEAYLDVERAMRSRDDKRDRYASDE